MRSIYQEAKSRSCSVNLCEGCLEKQQEIDRLKAEIQALREKLSQHKRQAQTGFFGSSTPSAQIPVKANAKPEAAAKRGGAKVGHPGNGRKKHSQVEIDEIRELPVEPFCSHCHSLLISKGYRQRSVFDIDPVKAIRRSQTKIQRSVG